MSLDNDLRTLLDAEADRYEPPARIPSGLLRRARIQRLGAAAGTVLGVAAVLVTAVALAGSLVGTTTRDRPSVPANDPLPGTVIDGPDGHAAYVVATGKDQGADWTLLAHEDENGLCVDIEHGLEAGGGCGEFKPNRLSMTIDPGDGNDPVSILGPVGPKVDSVVIEYQTADGEPQTISLERGDLYDAPRQISLPVRFFVVILPLGAAPERVAALDASGGVVDEHAELDLTLEDTNPQTGPQEQIATGRIEGLDWEFVARPHAQGPCFEFFLGAGQSQGGGGSCSSEADGPRRLALSQTTFENHPDVAPAFGVAPAATEDLWLEPSEPTPGDLKVHLAGDLFDAPDRFGKVKFFLVFPPNAESTGTVVASDGSGEMIARGKLCAIGAPPGSTSTC
ncbi:MAG: hypothetical protein ACRDJ2_14490 [Actinomycetota bacterium]